MIRERETTETNRATQLIAGGDALSNSLESPSPNLVPIPIILPSQAKNQLLNSDFSHSMRTWFSATAAADEANKECAYWFSNTEPILGQILSTEDSFHFPANANETLKSPANPDYNADYADWDSAAGTGRMGTEKTMDALLPGRFVLPGRQYYVSFICARINQYTVFPSTAYIYAGFWLNNGGSSYWIRGTNAFAAPVATVTGSPATTTSRKYKIYARTDRARSFLSAEVTVAGAPSDTAFGLGARVELSWQRLFDFGILSYDVYRLTGATYVLLENVETGVTNYTDDNSFKEIVLAYPTATDDRSIALTTTRLLGNTTSVLNTMAVDGVSSAWLSLPIPIFVPSDFDASAGTEQWLRIGIGGLNSNRTDIDLPDVILLGANAQSDLALFTADMAGLAVVLTDANGNSTDDTIAAFVDAENVTLVIGGTGAVFSFYIIGGGDRHAILTDCFHQSYADGAVYSHSDEDATPPRPQYPVAAPNGSNQGGTGTGGNPTDGGTFGCVEENEPCYALLGNSIYGKRLANIKVGEVIESGNLTPNVVAQNSRIWCDNLWIVEARNGCKARASPSNPTISSRMDLAGTPTDKLKIGGAVRTWKNGKFEQSKIVKCEPTGKGGWVRKLACSPTPYFIAGRCEPRRKWLRKIFEVIISFFDIESLDEGGIMFHNAKPGDGNPTF